MEKWEIAILKARDAFEIETGRTPTHVAVRQEVWADMCISEVAGTYSDIWEIEGMIVCVSDYLDQPFELLVSTSAIARDAVG